MKDYMNLPCFLALFAHFNKKPMERKRSSLRGLGHAHTMEILEQIEWDIEKSGIRGGYGGENVMAESS